MRHDDAAGPTTTGMPGSASRAARSCRRPAHHGMTSGPGHLPRPAARRGAVVPRRGRARCPAGPATRCRRLRRGGSRPAGHAGAWSGYSAAARRPRRDQGGYGSGGYRRVRQPAATARAAYDGDRASGLVRRRVRRLRRPARRRGRGPARAAGRRRPLGPRRPRWSRGSGRPRRPRRPRRPGGPRTSPPPRRPAAAAAEDRRITGLRRGWSCCCSASSSSASSTPAPTSRTPTRIETNQVATILLRRRQDACWPGSARRTAPTCR